LEAQQLAITVNQLESRVAALEDEGKIVRGEVKQMLTEIRSSILVRDNPFDADFIAKPVPQVSDRSQRSEVTPDEPTPLRKAPEHLAAQQPAANEPIPLRPEPVAVAPQPQAPQQKPALPQPAWSLLTIAALSAWCEDAVRSLGSLRLDILLDLCEGAGLISPEVRASFSRVVELDVPGPERAPSTNETAAVLRQLEALLNDEPAVRARAA
jgi:hypothetical protein